MEDNEWNPLTKYKLIIDDREMLESANLVGIKKTIEFEADGLQEVLQGMSEALRAAGFTYINALIAVKEDGTEVSSEDYGDGAQIDIEDFLKDMSKKTKPSHLRVVDNGQEETES